jgi:peptide/nickel transport system permease protein
MTTYIFRRVIQGFLVMLGVTFICFVIFRFTGDPAAIIAGQDATPAQIEEVRQAYGLDKPFYIQYALWLSHSARGDFGLFCLL